MVDFDIKIPTKLIVRIFSKKHERIRDAPVWGVARYYPQSIIFLFWEKSHQYVFITQNEKAHNVLSTLLEHEILHHVLNKISRETSPQLDNIHIVVKDGFITDSSTD